MHTLHTDTLVFFARQQRQYKEKGRFRSRRSLHGEVLFEAFAFHSIIIESEREKERRMQTQHEKQSGGGGGTAAKVAEHGRKRWNTLRKIEMHTHTALGALSVCRSLSHTLCRAAKCSAGDKSEQRKLLL
jgi:hypothetical protein